MLGQPPLDPILDTPDDLLRALSREEPQGLIGAKLVAARGLSPDVLKVGAVGELLCAAVLEREVAQLTTLRRTTVASTEPVSRSCDLSGAPGERVS